MEEIVTYLLKSSGLLATFFLAYHFLLRKETFFTSNRWFLLSGLATSILLPLFFIKKIVYVESPKITLPISPENNDLPIIIDKATPITTESIDWLQILFIVYGIVAAILIIKVIIDLFSLAKLLRKQTIQKQEDLSYVNINQDIAPFSFFNYIVFNSSLYSQEELESILLHEKIHSQEKHSIDVLVAKLFTIVFWFNPLIWFYQKAIIQNLEYIADSKAIQNIEDKKCYQMALLKVVSHQNCLPITNHFYQSLIKKRIVMLNKNQSNKKSIWKYTLILPVIIAFVFLFQIKTVAQTKENKTKEVPEYKYAVSSKYSSILTKNTTDQEIKAFEKMFSDEKQKLTISNVKRNGNDEIIAIKLEFDFGKTYNRVMERKSDKGINNIKIYINSDEDDDLAYGFEDIESKTVEAILIEENEPKENFWWMDDMKKNGKDVVLIINGKINGKTEKVKLPMDEEIGEMKEITPSEFEKKYNQKANLKKYYYEVTTTKSPTVGILFDEETKVEEENKTSKTSDNEKIIALDVQLDSNDPDKGWYSMLDQFKEQNITTEVSNIKRNKNNKIIAINIIMKSKDGRVQKLNIDRTNPIKSIIMFVDNTNNPNWDFGIKEGDDVIIYKK
ncbi:M56 family metallopeptidase [Flavobacterium sp.]|jgi:beta-lactamase regulating signal transducer with metallopeptidase domain|uniref:M56 family metallopeptidase n=1 Tax=Flavobacterium sp. TaxID=239 RepID=UPI0037BF6969